ncbi:hypothetical protein [Colwellia psychrerythraea]|uniref:Uncharacterized protein n=1 Tax=Colwellia psychrerythraea TaxID=28229 RepID=A0A099K7R7_COLPS|nr:hypothetical protein [Colwellia psychrerythraea]KGJ86416.1 hypothetical protein ND2E_0982 [Colwellia psychrerythraea]
MIKTKQQHNQQNNLIIKQMNKAQRAISELINNGVTVLNVEMARQKPRIEIQSPKKITGETLVIRGTKNGIREDINFSTHNGCIIFWKQ